MEATALRQTLEALPEETEREFELTVTRLVDRCPITDLAALENSALALLGDRTEDSKVRFASFWCLQVLYRHRRDVSRLRDLFVAYTSEFEDKPAFAELYILLELEYEVGLLDRMDLLRRAQSLRDRYPDNAGPVHLFAHAVATVWERSTEQKYRDRIERDLVHAALEAVERAIELDRHYARYYCTAARLHSIVKDYKTAFRLVAQAEDVENSERPDYALRIAQYQSYGVIIQIRQELDRLENEQDAAGAEIDRKVQQVEAATMKNLEFIGLFAGIISFTIGSLQIAGGQPFREAARLIIVLLGALLVAYSGFGIVIGANARTDGRQLWRPVLVAALGSAMIAGSIGVL